MVGRPTVSPCTHFSLPTLWLLREAVSILEQALQRNKEPSPKYQFAEETVLELKTKLDSMLQKGNGKGTAELNGNDLYMLYAGVHMYLAKLILLEQDRTITPACILLCQQLGALMKEVGIEAPDMSQALQDMTPA